ncbi:MAG: magnesium transporter, partial [Pseudomonadota bacterium]
ADVAAVLEILDTEGRISIFQLISDPERQADILSHIGKKFQLEIAHVFEIPKLQQLLGFMDSDDAADLLGHLPDELSQKVLAGLNKDELQEVEELMSYPEDSAGGLMSSEFLTIDEGFSVREAIAKIQEMDEDLISFYIYVVNDSSRLVGVLSLKQLLLSRPQDLLKDIMSMDVISVDLSTDQNEVAKVVEKYDFLSLPVTDENQNLVGVITVDDVIDVIREEAAEDIQAMGMGGADLDESYWTHLKARTPWLVLAGIGGAVCYFLLLSALKPFQIDEGLVHSVGLLPLTFFLVSTLSSQTVTMLVGFLRAHSAATTKSWLDLKKELGVGLTLAFFLSGIFVLIGFLIQSWIQVPLILGGVLALQMALTILISMGIPLFIGRLNFDPIVSAPSVSMILSNIFSVGILVLYYAIW